MWGLSSPTRDWTRVPCIRRQTLNRWTAREILRGINSLCKNSHCAVGVTPGDVPSDMMDVATIFLSLAGHHHLGAGGPAVLIRFPRGAGYGYVFIHRPHLHSTFMASDSQVSVWWNNCYLLAHLPLKLLHPRHGWNQPLLGTLKLGLLGPELWTVNEL